MDRSTFLKRSFGAGALAACGAAIPARAQEPSKDADPAAAFRETWVKNFLKNLDASLGVPERAALMEANGRDCARRGAIRMAESSRDDMAGFVEKLGGLVGAENAALGDGKVVLIYRECYCPMVSAVPGPLSQTWCECSRGWVLQMFETVAGRPLNVALVSSIKRGDPVCRFEVEV
jgi:predicted hydrocarbon binding protein